jgi:hypothetical protein
MNTLFEYSQWMELGVILTIASTAIVAVAYLAERLIGSAVWRRTLWQAAAAGLVLILAVEMTGMGRGLGQLMVGSQPSTIAVEGRSSETRERGQGPTAGVEATSLRGPVSLRESAGEYVDSESRSVLPAAEVAWLPEADSSLDRISNDRMTRLSFSDNRINVADASRTEFVPSTGGSRSRVDVRRTEVFAPLDATAEPVSTSLPNETTLAAAGMAPKAYGAARSEPPREESISLWPAFIWCLVAVAVAAYVLAGQVLLRMFCAKCGAVHDSDLLRRVRKLARRLGLSAPVRVVESPRLATPVAFGTLRPTIALPAGFAGEFEADEQEAMLVHELAHLAAGDPAWQQVVHLLCAVLWWQPAVWLLRRRLRVVCETAADEASLAVPEGPQHLAACLVAMGRRLTDGPRLGWISMTGDGYRSILGRRVMRLLKLEPRTWRAPRRARAALAKSLIVILLIVTMVFCTAWVRPRAALAQGDSTMTQLKVTWSRSLAAAALAVVVGSFSGDTAADQPQVGDEGLDGIQVALLDDEGEEREGEARRERDREEGEREGEGRRERDREEGEREERGDREREGDDREEEREERGDRERDEREGEGERHEARERDEGERHHEEREREAREREEREEENPERVIHELRQEMEELAHHARELKGELEELPDDADERARDIQEELERVHHEMEEIEGALRERLHGEREREGEREGERRPHPEEVLHHMAREREELMQHGRELTQKLEHARREGNEGAVRELEGALAHLKEKFQAVEREMREIREGIGHRERPQPEGHRPEGGPRAELERRLHHLRVAADNLRAAGMHDQAEQLMRQAEGLARELGHREEGPPREHHPDRPRPEGEREQPHRPDQPRGENLERAVVELHQQMREMHGQMEEMRNVLKQLVEREKARER